jgi:hypothetical protein
MATSSIGGAKYFLTLIDNFFPISLGIHHKILRMRCLESFGNSNLFVDIQSNLKIKCLKTNGRGQYISNAFEPFLISKGISW